MRVVANESGCTRGAPEKSLQEREADDYLRRCLEGRFAVTGDIHRTAFDGSTSFRLEILTVVLSGGGEVKALLKDFGASRLPKDGLPARRERELRVYRDLLPAAGLGTPEYHGAVWDETRGRFWLVIEFVNGVELRNLKFEDWVTAAGWLGRLHGSFARRAVELAACEFLVRHDAPFFRAQAELALRAVSSLSDQWAKSLDDVLRRYDEAVEVMVNQPRSLVHGSFRPQNILVERGSGPARVAAIDWELAAFGAPLYDFAFLSDGFQGERLDLLWETYGTEAAAWGAAIPERAERQRIADCFRWHKALKSLGDSASLKFDEKTVLKLLAAAAELRDRVSS